MPSYRLRPFFRFLPFAEVANVLAAASLQRGAQFGRRRLPRLLAVRLSRTLRKSCFVPGRPIARAYSAVRGRLHGAHIFDNPPHLPVRLRPTASCARAISAPDVSLGGFAGKNPHYITTLFSGYSTMPCALASFSRGITSQAGDSSITVFTASHSGSLRVEIVGRFQARAAPRAPRPDLLCAHSASGRRVLWLPLRRAA